MRRPPEPAVRKCPAGTSGPSAGHSMALRLPWESGMACVPVPRDCPGWSLDCGRALRKKKNALLEPIYTQVGHDSDS